MQDFTGRIERLCQALKQEKRLAAVFLEPGTNFLYLTGLSFGKSERLIAAILTVSGKLHIVGPAFEKDRLQACKASATIHTWQEDEDPYTIVNNIVLEEGSHWLVAVGPTTRFFVVEKLRIAIREDNIVDAGPFLKELRLRKDEQELNAIRASCKKTLAVMNKVLDIAEEGMTELELASKIGGGIVQFSENAAIPHGGPTDRKLEKDDVVLVDTGTAVDGYWSDLTRTFSFGKPTRELKKIHQIVAAAQKGAIEAVRPGVTCESVDEAARSVIENAGYAEFFPHRTGHGLGLDVHEPPYLVKGNKTLLEPGMVVTVEPGIYLPGVLGVRIEDDVAVTEDGHEVLSRESSS